MKRMSDNLVYKKNQNLLIQLSKFQTLHEKVMSKVMLVLLPSLVLLACAKPQPVESWYQLEETPLVETVFQAARQKNAKHSIEYVEQAKELVKEGADVTQRGSDGRTALHWVAIGAILSNDLNLDQAYWELAELLIANGADVNAEDVYGNTPLDWQEIGSNDDILELLIANGAETGYGQDEVSRIKRLTGRLYDALDQGDIELARAAVDGDLRAGTQIPIRLTTSVSSQDSKPGDHIEAVVIAPVDVKDLIVIPPGTKVEGTVLYAEPIRQEFSQAQLMLDFANLVHPNGSKTRISTVVSEVKNAKETLDRNRIIGTRFKTNNNTISWANRVLGWFSPGKGVALEALLYGYGRSVDRKIVYEPGVEMVITVVFPHRLNEIPEFDGWPTIEPSPELVEIVNEQPIQVQTTAGKFSDITNVMLIGSREEIINAFNAAGWVEAQKVRVKSGLTSFYKFMTDRGYETGPFSSKHFDASGQKANLELQKSNNTFAKRHHVRIWKRPQIYKGKEVWVGAATHDIGYGVSGKSMIHIIDRRVDRERNKIRDDLMFTGLPQGHSMVERPQVPKPVPAASMGGTTLITDGRILVVYFGSDESKSKAQSHSTIHHQ